MSSTKSQTIKESLNVPISAKEICAIIKASKDTGVKNIKFGDISIEFHEKNDTITDNSSIKGASTTQAEETDRKDAIIDTSEGVDIVMEQLLLEDPMKYEEMVTGEDGDAIV